MGAAAGATGAAPGTAMGETGSVDGAGAPTMDEAPLSAVAAVCSTAPMPAGLAASCWIMPSAGTSGMIGGNTGSAAAAGLNAIAAPRPAAAIALAANSFAKRDM